MHTAFRIAAAAILFAGVCAAQKFDNVETARKASLTSDKPVLVLAYFACPGQTDSLTLINKAFKADAGLATTAQKFQLASVDLYDREAYPANDGFNPALEKEYGTPCTVSAYAPGAVKHFWRKQLAREVVMQDTKLSDGQIKTAFEEAAKAWEDAAGVVADLEAEAKEDKKLKSDPDHQLKIAEAWAKVFASAKAREAFEEAIKLIRKADKTDARIENLTLRAAEVEFESGAWTVAAKNFGDFASKFKESTQTNHARVMQQRAVAFGGDPAAAKVGLEKMLKDKKAEDAKAEIEKAIAEADELIAATPKK